MRLLNGLRKRAAQRTMLEIERTIRKPWRCLAYAAIGTAAAILISVWAWDASGTDMMNERQSTQRARAW